MADAWKILVVEDTFDDMQVMVTTLQYHGIDVLTASNPDECQAVLAQTTPDIVVTDLAMPRGDGWVILECIRENANTSQTPVIAVTAYHSDKLQNEVLDGGFDGYIPKPINPMTFVDQLREILGV